MRFSALRTLLPSRRHNPASSGRLPAATVEVSGRHVRVGDRHTTTLAIAGYAAEVGAGWPEPLLSYPGRLDVTWHYEAIPPATAAQRLRRQRARLESTRRHGAAHGRLDDPDLDAAAEDAADLAAGLARGHGRLFLVGMHLAVHASSEDELAERVDEVRALASSLLLDAAPVTWRQLQGFIAGLPLAVDPVGMRRTFDTTALAAGIPFTSPDLPADPDGILYGLNLHSPGVVTWNRWAQVNFNSVILGKSGGGKSYLAKLDTVRNAYLGAEADAIDDAGECKALAAAVGGTIISLGAPGVKVNPFDISPEEGANALTRRALFAHTLVSALLDTSGGGAAGMDPRHAAALDAAVIAAYAKHGINADPRTWRRPAPLLGDVTAALHDHGQAGRDLAAGLRPFISGSYAGLFDAPSTVRPEGHLVVWSLNDLPDELKPVGTLLALNAIWRKVTRAPNHDGTRPRRLVLIDEAWLLLRSGRAADYLLKLAKSARKHGAGLSVVTQDVGDVLSTDIGRAVINNSATQILLGQAPQAIDAVTEAYQLTDGERSFLLTAGRGEALLLGGSARAAFQALASPEEHALITTEPTFVSARSRNPSLSERVEM